MKKAEDCNTVDEVLACLKELEEDPNRLVRNAKELEQTELEIPEYTNRISALLLKKRSKPQQILLIRSTRKKN